MMTFFPQTVVARTIHEGATPSSPSEYLPARPARRIMARAAGPLPNSIEWCPGGAHKINAMKGDSPWSGTVIAEPGDVMKLNRQLEQLLRDWRNGERPRPYVDFDHKGGAAAAFPVRFTWEDGIRLEVEWTSAGREAVEGGSYSYVSPEMLLSDDGGIEGLARETDVIGSLVNSPAFRRIKPVMV